MNENITSADSHLASASRSNETADGIESRVHAVSSPRPLDGDEIRIEIKIYDRGVWKDLIHLIVDSFLWSDVERVMLKYIRKGIRPFDIGLGMMGPKNASPQLLATD